MIVALLVGKHNSGGVKGKNYMEILGRPLVEYPALAAANSKLVDKIYVSTDSPLRKSVRNIMHVLLIAQLSWHVQRHLQKTFLNMPMISLKQKFLM